MIEIIFVIVFILCLPAFLGCDKFIENKNNKKKIIIVVSFGSSYEQTRKKTIEAIENKIINKFYDYKVKRAFTSQVIIDKLHKRDNIKIDNVNQAMKNLIDIRSDIEEIIIQPTHIINGFEYEEMIETVKQFESKFKLINYGKPLLSDNEDYKQLVEILLSESRKYNKKNTAIVFVGHGTKHNANFVYIKLDKFFKDKGYLNYFVSTIESNPSFNDIIKQIDKLDVNEIVLFPLMIVSGDHVINDISSDEKGSWKNSFESKGYKVKCILKGLGEYSQIQDMFVKHIENAKSSK